MQRCLVTGASGFLGRFLLDALQQAGYFVRALQRMPQHIPQQNQLRCQELIVGDLHTQSASTIEAWLADIDTVFHLAGTAHVAADKVCYEADSRATVQLAQTAARLGVQRFVYVSSVKAVADFGDAVCDENWNVWPTDAYGYWKRVTEERLIQEVKIPHVAIIRPSLIYGVGVKGNLNKMIHAIHKGYFPPISSTASYRSMVFASDVATALLLSATHPQASRQPLIVADGEPYTSRAIYNAIRQSLQQKPVTWSVPTSILKAAGLMGDTLMTIGLSSPINSDTVSRLMDGAAYSSAKLQQLGWTPTTTLYRELPAMVAACLEGEQ